MNAAIRTLAVAAPQERSLDEVPCSEALISCRQAEQTLKERLRFEELLTELSSAFIHVPAAEVDTQIDVALRRLGELLDVDRTGVIEVLDPGARWRPTHFWEGPRFDHRDQDFQLVIDERFPWLAENTRQERPTVVANVDDLPPEASGEKRYCETLGVRAFLMVPFVVGGSCLGNVFFESLSERPWPDELIQRLRLVAEVIANALKRQSSELDLRRALGKIEELKERLEAENVQLRREVELHHRHAEIVGESEPIRRVLGQAEQVAATDSTVLLLGETGTGKDLVARAIHRMSPRRDRAMIKINCAALPSTLVEGELFGREKGAYTGAVTSQAGRFEAAHGSTLFLDEIGELSTEIQAKLLRVLEDGELERLGSTRTRSVDVRVVAATNRDLEDAIADGTFREDLYYRLAVFPITVPPLRERRGDVPLLLWAFARKLGESMGKTIESIPRRTLQELERYRWPGNVRELKNVVERAMILTRTTTLQIEVPGATAQTPAAAVDLTLDGAQRRHVLEMLGRCAWKVRGAGGAADLLGMKPSTLENRMNKLGIYRPGNGRP